MTAFEVFPSPSEEAVLTADGEDYASVRKWFRVHPLTADCQVTPRCYKINSLSIASYYFKV